MSASDSHRPSGRIRARTALVIRRSDHVGDPVGLAFLESPETNGEAVLARLREYLGDKLKLLKAEVSHDEITVEVEARRLTLEAATMAATAHDMYQKGARRSALSIYRDALELDPLNADAIFGIAEVLLEQRKFAEALRAFKRAHEFGKDGIDVLLAMGRCAMELERVPSAVVYYEQALTLEPRNFVARRALSALGHKAAVPSQESGAVRSGRD